MRIHAIIGTLSFGLTSAASAVVFGTGPGGNVPDATTSHTTPGFFSSSINLPAGSYVGSVNAVTINFGTPFHTFVGDLQITLTAPNGDNVHLISRPGSIGATSFGDSSDFGGTYTFVNSPQGTTFAAAATAADAATPVANGVYQRSTNPLAGATVGVDNDDFTVFNNDPVSGNWTIRVWDWGVADTGRFASWAMDLTLIQGCGQAFGSCPGDVAPLGGNGVVDIDDLVTVITTWGQSGLPNGPRPRGDTAPGANGDCLVNIDDLVQVITTWGNCAVFTGACALPNNTCVVNTAAQCTAASGKEWVKGQSCADSDADRIPNAFEMGICAFHNPPYYGTSFVNADTDADGVSDGNEAYGSTAGLDLPGFGCLPCRKDLLIETDWMRTNVQAVDRNKLDVNQANRVIAAFNAGLTTNPNGINGIKMHIDRGQAPYSNGNEVLDPNNNDTLDMANFNLDGSEFIAVKTANFAANRHGFFRYCLMHDKYSVGGVYQNSSGVSELPGDDFCVTMGQWALGNNNFIGNTFMHELGHAINLRHGGNEDRNFKPNYNSIMNYWYQFCGTDTNFNVIPDNALDYSRGVNIALNENGALNEPAGVTGAGPAIDWNQNAVATDINVLRNINCRLTNTFANSVCGVHAQQTNTCGTVGQCYDSTCNTLTDFNDWTGLSLLSLNDADFVPTRVIHCWLDDYEGRPRK